MNTNRFDLLVEYSLAWICPKCDSQNIIQCRASDTSRFIIRLILSAYSGRLSDADSSLHSLPDGATCSSPRQYQQVKANNLTVIVINTQSIMAKKESLWQIIDNHRPDVILASETWLKNDIHDSEIIPADFGFELFRKERRDGYGGVLIAVKCTLI